MTRFRQVEDAARLSRNLLTLSQCSRALWQARGEQELLASICQILVETAGVRLAWIGYCEDDAEKTIRPVARAGNDLDYLERIKFSWGNSDSGQGPTGNAIRTGKFCWIDDIRSSPRSFPGPSGALSHEFLSCVAFPLIADLAGHLDLRGALTLYGDAFDKSEIDHYADLASYLTCAVAQLRGNLAGDLSYGVTAIRAREDRKRAEDALRERAELLDLTHDTVFVRNMNNVITFWNRGAEELYGWKSEQAVGMVSHQLMQTVFPAPLEEINSELLRTGRWDGELVHTKRDGLHVVVASRWALRRDEQDAPTAILETNNDITEQKRVEDALRDSEERWRATFENNPTMYFMVDTSGAVMSVNTFGAEQLGYRADELIGRPFRDLSHEADREAVQTNTHICLEQVGQATSWELRKIRKDGEIVWVRATARAMLMKNQLVVLVACEDITEAKRATEALSDVQVELARANRLAAMGQLAASIAHEVRQPIGATVTNAQAALRFLDSKSINLDEIRQIFDDIVRDGKRAGEVFDRIRDLTKKTRPRKDRFEINAAIREVIELTRGEAAKDCISVQAQLAEGLPLVEGDRVQLQQVVVNLIINAIQAMSGLSEDIRTLHISTDDTECEGVRVAVRDSGPGLSPDYLEHLFEPFYTTKPSGTGIGLSICRSIIEAHGGSLTATANMPRGALFQFTLPVRRAEAS